MLGRTDFDFNPPTLAAQYVEEDRRVMETRQPQIDQVWLVQSADGMPRWYLSSKFPVFGARDAVIGIAGVMRLYEHAGTAPGEYRRLTAACEFVLANYAHPIAIADLARRAHLSASQLQREFRRLFRMNPGDYILRVRLLMARRQLEETSLPVGQIALDCGFYDQSHFTRAFRASTGLSPLQHRRRFATKGA
jgi:AraC-like DNA-binding protein